MPIWDSESEKETEAEIAPARFFFFSATRAVTSHPASVPRQMRMREMTIRDKLIRR
jgi:hypothetical protein